MKRQWMILLLLLSLGLNLGLVLGVVLRQEAPPPPPRGQRLDPRPEEPAPEMAERFMHRRVNLLSRKLELDAEQRQALVDVYERSGPEVFRQRSLMRKQRLAIRELILGPDPDWSLIAPGLRKQAHLQSVLDSLVVRVMFEERLLLNDAQLPRYRRYTSPLGESPGGDRPGRGRRGGRGDGPPPRP